MNLDRCLQGIIFGLAGCVVGMSVSSGQGQENVVVKEEAALGLNPAIIENAKKLVRESRRFHQSEIEPLQQEGSAKTARVSAQVGLQLQYLRELNGVNDDSLAKVRKEMQQAADRLEMLARLESVLTDMNPDAIRNAVADGSEELSELQQERNEIAKPINQEVSLIVQANAHRNKELTSVMNRFFKEAGVDKLSGLVRKYPSANFVYSHYTCRYENDKEGIVIHVTLQFATNTADGNAVQKIDGKHVVSQWNDDHVIVLLNGMHLNVHDSSHKLNKHQLMAAVKQLIDLDGLAQIADRL